METGILKAIAALLSADNVAIVALTALAAVLLWLLVSERKRCEQAWTSHAKLLEQNNQVLGSLVVIMEVVNDRMR